MGDDGRELRGAGRQEDPARAGEPDPNDLAGTRSTTTSWGHRLWRAASLLTRTGALIAVIAVAIVGLMFLLVPAPPGLLDADDGVPLVSVLTDDDGVPFARLFDQYRLPVPGADLGEPMKAAIVAIEDRRFYDHGGVDVAGVLRAIVRNATTSGNPFAGQGASTITMQYVKNQRAYTAGNTQRQDEATADTLGRKLLDLYAAVALEREFGKSQILERYLNTVYFGNGAYGVAAAADTYFGTRPTELTLAQSALLAGLVRSPSRFDPVDEPEAAVDRRDLVLSAMVEIGSVTPAEAAAARAEPLGVVTPLRQAESGCSGADPGTGFFCAHVLDVLARDGLTVDDLGVGGYTVATTLDRAASEAATRAATEQVPTAGSPGIANAMAVVAPGTDSRRVLALAVNRTFGPDAAAGQSAFSLPTAPVPYGAGSTFKIFTAAAALEAGTGLTASLPAPESYTSRVFTNGSEPYTVTGANGAPATVTLQQALALSPNTTFVALLDELGSVDPAVDMAYRLGMRDSLAVSAGPGQTVRDAVRAERRASFTLGPVPAIPLELANVGATIASGGVWCPPTVIEAVADRAGRPVPLTTVACEQVVPKGLADTLTVGMSEGATGGTAAAAARAAGWDRPMLAKTGTTQDSLSAGFLGATPQLSAAVMTWSDGSPPQPVCSGPPLRLCDGGDLSGGGVPAATWFAAMRPLHDGFAVAPIPAPDPAYVGAGPPPAGGSGD